MNVLVTYPLSSFGRAASTDRSPAETLPSGEPATDVDLEALDIPELLRKLIRDGRTEEYRSRYKSRSEAVFAVLCGLIRRSIPDEVIASIVLNPKNGISEHVLGQPKPVRYASRQIAQARARVADDFECDRKGCPLYTSQRNIRIAMAKLDVVVRYDLFAGRDLIEGLEGFGPFLDDAAANRLWLLIDEQFGFRPTKDLFQTVLSDEARTNTYHPVQEYLAGIRWDGVPRIERWLTTYGGAPDTPYTRAVGELVLVAGVRRVRQPGVKFDEMLVLESPQGTNKSTALKVLAVQEDWFSDDLPLNADTKRVIEALSGKWIVEAGELKGMRRGDVEHLKGFLSRTRDKARMAYDRREKEVPRQCVIIGTTNDRQYLKDTTGNRRFWPVLVDQFDIETLRRDRDQLWAEAAQREALGKPIRLDPKLWEAAAAEQDERRVEEPIYERLHAILGETLEGKIKAEDVWKIVGKRPGSRTQEDNGRVGDAMRRLRFKRKQLRFGGPNPERCYVRGDASKQFKLVMGEDFEVDKCDLSGPDECEQPDPDDLPF